MKLILFIIYYITFLRILNIFKNTLLEKTLENIYCTIYKLLKKILLFFRIVFICVENK